MVMLHNKRKGMFEGALLLVLLLLIIPQILSAQNSNNSGESVETPFNVGEVIEKVTHHPIREGDRIVIKDRAYEAFFDEQGVILKPRQKKGKAEDLIIPIKGNPVIKDGKVIYHTEYGDIIFSGTSRGLNFEERWKSSITHLPNNAITNSPSYLITQYTGKVARLENEKTNEYSRTGEFLIDTNVVYVPAPAHQLYPSVAFDGTNYLVVWHDYRSDPYVSDIYGARVSQSGTVLDPNGIPISTTAYNQYSPSVAFDGTNYLVVWCEHHSSTSSDIYGARVSQNGTVLDTAGIPISTAASHQYAPSVAFDGTNYLVVWCEYHSSTSSDIYGARVSPSGTVLDPQGIPISTAANWQRYPSVAFDGTNYLVVWLDYRSGSWDIYGARVSQNGTVLDPNGIPISTTAYSQYYPSVAFDGTNYLVVWSEYRSGTSDDIYGARVSPSGTVLDTAGIPISTAAYSQGEPSVAFDGTNYLVVWNDYRSGTNYDIYGARVSQSGTVLDPQGIPISTAASHQYSPSVAFDGTNYLVVWSDDRSGYYNSDIYGARVSPSGTVLDPNGIPISTATNPQWSPSVAFGGTNYLVVWEDSRSGIYIYDIYGARVSQNGAVLDPQGIPISTAAYGQYSPSVAFDGTNYLVVWNDYRSGTNYDIYGARVSQNGTVLDPNGIPISTAAYSQEEPSVAFDGTNYLVVWNDYRSGTNYDIYGARVSQSGTVLDTAGIPISTAADYQEEPSVAFDGTNYLVVWEDSRSGSYYDIYGARVSPSGLVIDSFPVSTQPDNQTSPAVAHGIGNQLLIVYSGFTYYINNHPANTMRIWGKFYPFTGIEESEGLKAKGEQLKLEVFPNPFYSSTRIRYGLEKPCGASLKIYNITGQCVRTLVSAKQNASVYEITWNGKDDNQRELPQGIYFLRIKTDGYTETKKMVLLH